MADLEHPLEPPTPAPVSTASVALGLARAKLNRPRRRESVWRLLGAAGFAAGSALLLAAVVILGPPAAPDRQADVNPWVR